MLEIVHNVEHGVQQLLSAPSDLTGQAPEAGTPQRRETASAAHQDLYSRYVADMTNNAYPIAENWWQNCVGAFVQQGMAREQAIDMAFDKRLAGPASAPEFVWFIRHYWLRCAELNETLPVEQRVPPETLLLGWLVDEQRDDFVTLVTCMPYWPLGLDSSGRWC